MTDKTIEDLKKQEQELKLKAARKEASRSQQREVGSQQWTSWLSQRLGSVTQKG